MPKPANKPVIAIDVDDVLAANAEGFVKFSNQRWGTNLKADDYDEHWAEMWGVSHEGMEERRQVILEEKVFVSYRFFDEAKPVLKELSKSFELVVASSRSSHVQQDTIDWINKEFGELLSGIYFADMWDRADLTPEQRLKGTKTEILKKVKADYLIDDQPKHCVAAAKAGISSIVFGDYRWNRGVELLPNMAKAASWQEVLEYFEGRS